jgi:cation:H+ antiporter
VWLALLLLVVGCALLVAGGRAVVAGASRLAAAFGVSELAVGLTVVAFGTSAPELALNLRAAVRDHTAIAFGNIFGSNIANTALIVGASALVAPLRIQSRTLSREIPIMLLATAAAVLLGLDRIRGARDAYDRLDGLLLLLGFAIFLYGAVSAIAARGWLDPLARQAREAAERIELPSAGAALALVGVGLLGLAGGAELTVTNAVAIAADLGVPQVVIGLTLLALGTSLPELATCLAAVSRGQVDLAVGNVVGSNIFNLLFVLGVTATIREVSVPAGGVIDLAALSLFSLFLLRVSFTYGSRIVRGEGLVLLAAYGVYVVGRFALGSG